MQLKIIGSGSAGNGYILDNGSEALLIEAGFPFNVIQRNIDSTKRIKGCIVTHEHGDHAKYANEYYRRFIPVYTSHGTFAKFKGKLNGLPVFTKDPLEQFSIGNFTIFGLRVEHDAEEAFCYVIEHPETGRILFATDTYFLRYRFEGLNHILIECNYDQKLLRQNYDAGVINEKLYERTLQSHMSLETCISALKANDLTAVENIVLLHLSDRNSDESMFIDEVAKQTGKRTYAARAGLNIKLDKRNK